MNQTAPCAQCPDRAFWQEIRRGLRMVVSAIDTHYGFEDPCCRQLERMVSSQSHRTPAKGASVQN